MSQTWKRNLVVGQSTKNASALFQVEGSTSLGSKPGPTMTTAQRDAIATPVAGLIIFNSDTGKYNTYNGFAWTEDLSNNNRLASINFIKNPGAEINTYGWATYADAAATTPVNGTGGSPNITLSRTTTAAEILRGIASFEMVKDASDRQGEGVSYDFSIDTTDQGKSCYIQFSYQVTSNYASGDLRVFVYDVTNATVLNVTNDNDGSIQYAASPGSLFTGYFTPASNSTSYRLIFHITSTNASAYDFQFDEVVVTPQKVVPGSIVTPWVSFTPTGAWVSVSGGGQATYTGYWRRVGDSMELQVNVSVGGAPTSATLDINMPSGYTIDTNKLATAAANGGSVVGQIAIQDANAVDWVGFVRVQDASTLRCLYVDGSSNQQLITQAAPMTWASGDNLGLWARVPISGWSSGASLSTFESALRTVRVVAYNTSTQSFGDGADTDVTFNAESIDNFNAFNISTGIFTAPFAGTYLAACSVELTSLTAGTGGMRLYTAASTAVNIISSRCDIEGTSLALNAAGAIYLQAGETLKFRVFQNNGSSRSSVANRNTISITSLPDFSVFSIFGENRYLSATSSAFNLSTAGYATGEYAQMTGNSVPLTPGVWILQGTMALVQGTGTVTGVGAYWGTNNGANDTSLPTSPTLQAGVQFSQMSLASINGTIPAPAIRVVVNAETTIYLVGRTFFSSAGTGTVTASIYAEKIA